MIESDFLMHHIAYFVKGNEQFFIHLYAGVCIVSFMFDYIRAAILFYRDNPKESFNPFDEKTLGLFKTPLLTGLILWPICWYGILMLIILLSINIYVTTIIVSTTLIILTVNFLIKKTMQLK